MEIAKITKRTKIYGGDASSGHAKIQSRNKDSKVPNIYLTRYMHDFYCECRL